MSLARFFDQIAPTLLGEVSAAESAPKLGVDPRRLGIYERLCRTHRFEAIEAIYPHCKAAVAPELWPSLVEDFFRRHPMHHVELNANGAQWPEFLVGEFAARGLPAWLPELADFEWWEWQTIIALNETSDPKAGPLRLASCLEVRPYSYDLLEWIEEGRQGEPAPSQTFVLFWRDAELALRREQASQIELLVLKSVASGEALTKPLLKQLKISQKAVDETILDLREAGILLGG